MPQAEPIFRIDKFVLEAMSDDLDQCVSSLQASLQAAVPHSSSPRGLVPDHVQRLPKFIHEEAAPEALETLRFNASLIKSTISVRPVTNGVSQGVILELILFLCR
ncbi:hypothetical protein J6590_069480 [Homalodisca vitripennis]|nr:hypothetical protein J6590_069480 [Homalodisca vitripennis]